jgi:hypothetical protein
MGTAHQKKASVVFAIHGANIPQRRGPGGATPDEQRRLAVCIWIRLMLLFYTGYPGMQVIFSFSFLFLALSSEGRRREEDLG